MVPPRSAARETVMNHSAGSFRILVAIALVCVALPAAAQKRNITETDILKFVWIADPQISPDGSRVVLVRVDVNEKTDSYDTSLWIVPSDGKEPARRLTGGTRDHTPRWSPDGRRLAFVRADEKDGKVQPPQIHVLSMGGGEARAVTTIPRGAANPAWSPDGATIALLQSSPTDTQDLWAVEVASGAVARLTDSLPVGLRGRLSTPEKIAYPTFDRLTINAYLYRPARQEPGARCPAVLLIHGGPTSQFYDTLDPLAQHLAQHGYAVLLPNIRGSSGYGKQFEDLNNGDWGHGDLKDAIAGADWLRAQDWVDGAHVGITGTSYGGCLSMSAVCNAPGQFQAAAPHAGYADWVFVMGEQERRHLQLMHYEFGSFPEQIEVYRHCSPISNVRQVQAPTLVLHGEGQLPRSDDSRRFVEAMRREYKTVEYKVYPGECYYVRTRANLRQMYLDMLDFFDRYLLMHGSPSRPAAPAALGGSARSRSPAPRPGRGG